jgi:DNA polymerase III subunit epsilon
MREIVLDTETTGLSPAEGHRIVEIGAVELLNHLPTGQTYHVYLNPERDMPREAEAVHGLSAAFLKDKPLFAAQAQAFLDFIQDSTLIIHNAKFDMGFINAELGYTNRLAIPESQVTDTLAMARRTHPMGPNSLDALCKRHGIDNSKRTKHGALLDAELLADVYLEMIGGKQTSLGLAAKSTVIKMNVTMTHLKITQRPQALPPRLTEDELMRHDAAIASLVDGALWKN